MGLFKNKTFEDGYIQGRADAERDLFETMQELSLLNKRFAQSLIDAVRGNNESR